jgi:antitoxin component of MazEF toxin-antitoxin module
MGEITSISKASTTNESLRTTIPRAIVKQFNLTYKDQIEWIMKVEGGELVIQVKPIKNR